MKALEMRAEALARAAQRCRLARLADAVGGVDGVSVETAEAAVILRGRGVVRRWLSDAALRFASGLSR